MENLACYILQWNPSIAATLGEQNVDLYIGVAFIEGLFVHKVFIWDRVPGCYTEVAFIQGWPIGPLRGVPLYCVTVLVSIDL